MFGRNPLKRIYQKSRAVYRFGLTQAVKALTKGAKDYPEPIASFIHDNHRKLVGRSRQLLLKNDYGRGAVRLVYQNVIGSQGLRFQCNARKADNTLDENLNKAVETAWKEWSEPYYCTLDGQMDLVALQRACLTSVTSDGEAFVRFHVDEDSKYKLKVEILDAQRCSPVETSKKRARDVTAIQNGIIFDKATSKPISYLFSDHWTNDQYYDDHSTPNNYMRYPADEILHGFIPEQTLQRRGLPLLHASLDRLFMLDQYEEAGLKNAQVGAQKLGFLTWEKDAMPDVEVDLEKHPINTETGTFSELLPGMNLATFDTAYPHEMYEVYVRCILRAIAIGFGVSYASFSGDVSDANFSSIRTGAIGERENWRIMQEWFITTFMRPIFKRWLMFQIRNGTIKLRGRKLTLTDVPKLLANVKWTAKRWEWVDPKSEAAANSMAMKDLTVSPSQLIREMGKDPQEVFAQIGEDIKQMVQAGIPDDIVKDAFSSKLQQVEVEKDGESAESSNKKSAGSR